MLSGILARAATQQNMAEVVDYLATIDHKVDDVLRKVDDAQVAKMVGVAEAIERAWAIREETGAVNETLWSTVDQSYQTIAATQAYALRQLDVIARRLEDTKARDLAQAAALAETDGPKWLGVLLSASACRTPWRSSSSTGSSPNRQRNWTRPATACRRPNNNDAG